MSDPGAGFVAAPRHPTESESSGWGLHLVDRIADRWGVVTKDRNEVWFEIDLFTPDQQKEMPSRDPS